MGAIGQQQSKLSDRKEIDTIFRTIECWDEEVKEAIRVRRETYARCTSTKTTAGWEGYATARNKVKQML